MPGRGRPDRLFSDGGLFDNLPFLPAIEILADVQASILPDNLLAAIDDVGRRVKHRDVFIAAALNSDPNEEGSWDTLFDIYKQAGTLSANSKLASFELGCEQVHEALDHIAEGAAGLLAALNTPPQESDAVEFLNKAVAAAVVKVIPTDAEHVNPTFAFCRSTGLEQERVGRSIADGCYQSLKTFVQIHRTDPTVHTAFEGTRIAAGLAPAYNAAAPGQSCPFFELSPGKQLQCPFSHGVDEKVLKIRAICLKDGKHVPPLVTVPDNPNPIARLTRWTERISAKVSSIFRR